MDHLIIDTQHNGRFDTIKELVEFLLEQDFKVRHLHGTIQTGIKPEEYDPLKESHKRVLYKGMFLHHSITTVQIGDLIIAEHKTLMGATVHTMSKLKIDINFPINEFTTLVAHS